MFCIYCKNATKNNKFCSRSCANSYNNSVVPKRKKTRTVKSCIVCGKDSLNPLYCSNTCQGQQKFKETLEKFKRGEISDSNTLKKCLKETREYVCIVCHNNGTHNNIPLTLQMDHVDGNSDNNLPNNLRWLCPNCHSQTPTYAFKNKTPKNTKRENKRRLRYALGGSRTPIVGSVDLCPIH